MTNETAMASEASVTTEAGMASDSRVTTGPAVAYSDKWLSIYGGDCRDVMRELPAGSVDCIITSPPYYGLRDYGLAIWVGGDDPTCTHIRDYKPREQRPNPTGSGIGAGGAYFDAQERGSNAYREWCARCGALRIEPTIWGGDRTHEHDWLSESHSIEQGAKRKPTYPDGKPRNVEEHKHFATKREVTSSTCSCGAWRGALGLEPTPEMYVKHLVEVFREARRVLKPTGILWLNLGDSYASSSTYNTTNSMATAHGWKQDGPRRPNAGTPPGAKAKDLLLIPARVAMALQADGWWLRSDVVWHKPNPMPESVEDRPTKSHEHVFMLTKSERYFYDSYGWREPITSGPSDVKKMVEGRDRLGGKTLDTDDPLYAAAATTQIGQKRGVGDPDAGRNMRDVWAINTVPYPGAHFAVFPPTLVERPILVSTSDHGCCTACGAPWVRVMARRSFGQPVAERNGRVGHLGQPPQQSGWFWESPELLAGMDLSRPQARRALELAREHGLTAAHIEAIRAVGITDVGKARETQTGTGRNRPEMQALADEAKEALGGYYREFVSVSAVTTGWRPTCVCNAPPGVQPGDLEVINSPTGDAGEEGDTTMFVGRAGLARPRDPDGGYRPMTRYEQRHYAAQLKTWQGEQQGRALLELEEHLGLQSDENDPEPGLTAWAHYLRTDRAGARALPEALRARWVERGWLTEPVLPEWEPPPVQPAVVLDPFGGSGTVGLVAQRLRRTAILIDLSPAYLKQQMERAARAFGVGGRRLQDEGWKRPPPEDSLWALVEDV